MIMEFVSNILLSVVLTEAVTELLVKSELSSRFIKSKLYKNRENKICEFLHDLLDCGYCTSVWIGTATSILFIDYVLIDKSVSWLIFGLLTHRLSNLWHFVIDRVRGE